MRTILFHIPSEIGGIPFLGFGILLAIWVAICLARLGWVTFRRGWSSELTSELPMMLLLAAVIAFVLPALADESGLPIRGYGVMVFLGVISGVALAIYPRTARRLLRRYHLLACPVDVRRRHRRCPLVLCHRILGRIVSQSHARCHTQGRPQLHPRRTRRLRRLRWRCHCRRHLFHPPQAAGAEIRRHHRPMSRTRPRPGPHRLLPQRLLLRRPLQSTLGSHLPTRLTRLHAPSQPRPNSARRHPFRSRSLFRRRREVDRR